MARCLNLRLKSEAAENSIQDIKLGMSRGSRFSRVIYVAVECCPILAVLHVTKRGYGSMEITQRSHSERAPLRPSIDIMAQQPNSYDFSNVR